VTAERHHAYLAVKRFLKSIATLGEVELDLLADAAEALLLTRRGREDDATEAFVGAELVLNQLELTRRLDARAAAQIRTLLTACGPGGAAEERAGHRTRSPRVSPSHDADQRDHTHSRTQAG
jgi:hypothetical protein